MTFPNIWTPLALGLVALTLEGHHIFETGPRWDGDRRGEVVRIPVFVEDIFDEQHEQDVVLVLAGIHTPAEFIAGGPEGGVEIRFFDGYVWSLAELSFSFCNFLSWKYSRNQRC
jgi:hypothetical protein